MTTANSVNTYIVPTAANEVTMPSQPAFLAYNSVTDANVTGDGTVYTIIFDTVVFDQNSDYNNGTGTFTAPVTGRYYFNCAVLHQTIVAAQAFNLLVRTSNHFYATVFYRAGVAQDLSVHLSCFADMDAADTCLITTNVSGQGADTVNVFGGASPWTFFSGKLVC